jgi:hypothetical protein
MAMTLITDSSDSDSTDLASIVFSSGIDSTYKLYIFKFIDINPATDTALLSFQVNGTSDTGYDRSMTTTFFNAFHSESGTSDEAISSQASNDQVTGDDVIQNLTRNIGNDANSSVAGTMWLFNPSSTTYSKHFYSRINSHYHAEVSHDCFCGGVIHETAAIDDIKFQMDDGNFDGTIKMYGVG